MLVSLPTDSEAARLRALLERPAGLDEEAVAFARALPSALATHLVVSILRVQLFRPADELRHAIRAAHLVHALGLDGAIPVLVRCVEELPEIHPVRDAALSALSRLGSRASAALLSAIERATGDAARTSLGEVLAAAAGPDERVRAALVRMLEYAPATAAKLLARRGEWQAAPDIARALDRLATTPVADCPVCAWEDLVVLAAAVRVFGGELSEEQEASLEAARDRADDALRHPTSPRGTPVLPRAPARRARRPGRNDPCPCGSGKKYKQCHLRIDERGETH